MRGILRSMMILVIGGSGSGKSAYAENRTVLLSQDMQKYYLAAMQAYDAEAKQKIDRHRMLRSGKGFLTIEQPTEIHKALDKMKTGKRTALLECVSNLTANEMFSKGEIMPQTQAAEHVIRGIEILKGRTTHFIVVSNNIFEDGIIYDKETMGYIRAMGQINQRLAAMADQVVEVAAGIPVVLKSRQ